MTQQAITFKLQRASSKACFVEHIEFTELIRVFNEHNVNLGLEMM